LAALAVPAHAGKVAYRPSQEARTITTDLYGFSIQKNGRIDVELNSGSPVFLNAYPGILFDGEEEMEPLPIDSDFAARLEVLDPLGDGQGMVFKKKSGEWLIRTYPDKPFFVVQAAFVNTDDKPVRVKALYPWCVGPPKEGAVSLESGTTDALMVLAGPDGGAELMGDSAEAAHVLAAYNQASHNTLIAGFLTHDRGTTSVSLARTKDDTPTTLGQFRSVCTYDPPVEVAPGDILMSEYFYVAIAENNPLQGLDRFGHAVAAFNRIPRPKAPIHHSITRATGSEYTVTQDQLRGDIEQFKQKLAPRGWSHFAVGGGWQTAAGSLEPDAARFPNGLRSIADVIHTAGLTAGIAANPFLSTAASSRYQQHPDWYLSLDPAVPSDLPDGTRILDITNPDAKAYAVDALDRIASEWGFDRIDVGIGPSAILFATGQQDESQTRLEALRDTWRAVEESLRDRVTFSAGGPPPVTGLHVNTMDLGSPSAHDDAAALLARSARYAPYLGAFQVGPLTLSAPDGLSRLTLRAVTGSMIHVVDPIASLDEAKLNLLGRVLPSVDQPAYPVDLFREHPPRVWHLPLEERAGEWHALALFNWDSVESAKVPVYLARLGLLPDAYYALYDVWNDRHLGTGQRLINVTIGPNDCRLLVLRRLRNRPMLLGHDRHFTLGARDHAKTNWDLASGILSGSLNARPDTPYGIRVLVPEHYTVARVTNNENDVTFERLGKVVRFTLLNREGGNTPWRLEVVRKPITN
jgi:hypothetical protein